MHNVCNAEEKTLPDQTPSYLEVHFYLEMPFYLEVPFCLEMPFYLEVYVTQCFEGQGPWRHLPTKQLRSGSPVGAGIAQNTSSLHCEDNAVIHSGTQAAVL